MSSCDYKRKLKVEMLCKSLPEVVAGSSDLKRIYPRRRKGTEMPLLMYTCRSCSRYWHTYFCQNHFTPIKSSWFVCIETCSMHPLQLRYRPERLCWCKEHFGLGNQPWSRVMFSDESRFTVTIDSGYQLLRRERGTCFTQYYVRGRDRYDSDVLVWAGVMHNDRTPVHIFEVGSVTLERYYREIILDHVFLYMDIVKSDFLFIDGKTRRHRNFKVSSNLERKILTACNDLRIPWTYILLCMLEMLLKVIFNKELAIPKPCRS